MPYILVWEHPLIPFFFFIVIYVHIFFTLLDRPKKLMKSATLNNFIFIFIFKI